MPTDVLEQPQIVSRERFLNISSDQIPLTEIPYGDLKANIIDPLTKRPYKGIVLEGVFADLNQSVNNNNRVYDIPEYLKLLQILKKQIHSRKGVYGELEHPERYSVDYKLVSHKILDVWYNETEQKVYGRVLILSNTPNGKIAEDIIRSGGQLAISARAAGEEIKLSNGTKRAVTKLLVTFDLVYHPGFSAAVLEFKELNESQKIFADAGKSKTGFNTVIYEKQLKEIPSLYTEYISLNENTDCFMEWVGKKLNESQEESKTQTQKDEEKLQENEPNDQQKFQNKLSHATDKDLSEAKKMFQRQISQSQKDLKNLSRSFYDGSAGFVINEKQKKC